MAETNLTHTSLLTLWDTMLHTLTLQHNAITAKLNEHTRAWSSYIMHASSVAMWNSNFDPELRRYYTGPPVDPRALQAWIQSQHGDYLKPAVRGAGFDQRECCSTLRGMKKTLGALAVQLWEFQEYRAVGKMRGRVDGMLGRVKDLYMWAEDCAVALNVCLGERQWSREEREAWEGETVPKYWE